MNIIEKAGATVTWGTMDVADGYGGSKATGIIPKRIIWLLNLSTVLGEINILSRERCTLYDNAGGGISYNIR